MHHSVVDYYNIVPLVSNRMPANQIHDVINYRCYTAEVMLNTFCNQTIMFSRGRHFKSCSGGRPDTITVSFTPLPDKNRITLIARTTIYGNDENLLDIMKNNGFTQETLTGGLYYWWRDSKVMASSNDMGNLLYKLLRLVIEAEGECPFLLYASPVVALLKDYRQVVYDGTQDRRSWRDVRRSILKTKMYSLSHIMGCNELENRENHIPNKAYVAQLLDWYWIAWVDGDEIIPIYFSQREAEKHLIERVKYNMSYFRHSFV